METTRTGQMVVWHPSFNLDKKDNIKELPDQTAVFGLFGIVDDQPINCRYVGESENLQEGIKNLFETPDSEGLKAFMQGPWVKMLLYHVIPNSDSQQRQELTEEWEKKYEPKLDENGEYPGYYDF